MQKTVIVNNYEELMNYFNDGSLEIMDLFPISSKMLLLTYRELMDLCPIQKQQNVVIAAFTTSLARLHLYNEMEKLHPMQLLYTGNFSSIL